MTKEQAIKFAKSEMYKSKADGFVVIQYVDKSRLKGFVKAGYDIDCDYELFDNIDEMRNFLSGMTAHNYLDFATYLRDGERVLYAYSKTKLIIV